VVPILGTIASSFDNTVAARGLFVGGHAANVTNVIDYVEIATTGNAVDFGDRTVSKWGPGSCSNGHGGL
jgi:hypothetical protein